jgi:uncharacterized membrane protein YphA (DoxX/SURF4 family)
MSLPVPIPIQVLYAGLAGCVLALIVATIQNRWSLRVFFILALRLAIGWHFLFEGLHKVHSHYAGPSETTRPFTSEPYFREADGPLGPVMRQKLGDPDEQVKAKLVPKDVPAGLAKLPLPLRIGRGPNGAKAGEQGPGVELTAFARMVPDAVQKDWEKFTEKFAADYKLNDAEKRRLDGKLDAAEMEELQAAHEMLDTADPKRRAELAEKAGPGDLTLDALAEYGRWVAGVEPRPSQVKYVSGDTPLTGPQRREYIDHRQADLDELLKRGKHDLGVGYGYETNRAKDLKALVSLARSTLLADADAFLLELKKQAFAAVLGPRFDRQAPTPSKALAGPDENKANEARAAKLAEFAAAPVPEKPEFAALPADLRGVWEQYRTEFKNFYPVGDKAAEVDRAFELAAARFANWYAGRDEFTGQPPTWQERRPAPPSPGFGTLLKRFEDARQKGPSEAATARDVAYAALDARFNAMKAELAKELPAEVVAGAAAEPAKNPTLERLDWYTRWGLVVIGACLLAGLFTPLACLAGVAFLVLTYLTHPPFPWLPMPPGTEGNPVFVNKNVIEALGLLVVMVHPTGRWMGLDALLCRLFSRGPREDTSG